MAKMIIYGEEARKNLQNGIDKLSDTVKITNVVLDKKYGGPLITNDGVTIAKEIELDEPFENMGAQLVKEVATKTNDVAGDGTTTATLLAQALVREGMKNVAAGANPMVVKKGIKQAVEAAIEALGPTMYISEDMFQPFASYGCAGPMWVLKLIEAMIDAGVQSGFSREDARAMVLENVEGTAKTLKITGDHPAARVDKMTSPGGITIEGVKKLEEDGFAGTVMASVEAAVNKGNNV